MSQDNLAYTTFGYWFFHNQPEAAGIIEKADVCGTPPAAQLIGRSQSHGARSRIPKTPKFG